MYVKEAIHIAHLRLFARVFSRSQMQLYGDGGGRGGGGGGGGSGREWGVAGVQDTICVEEKWRVACVFACHAPYDVAVRQSFQESHVPLE